tara:strand:+ start:5748 stop:5921 length:174 start_codon:yes stop_codon:yes gene_type:complete
MNKEQAFEILEKGLNIANTKGAFLLRDATIVQQALDVIRTECKIPDPVVEGEPEAKE